jgi:spermidine/putrescine transport system ATP-binding protein
MRQHMLIELDAIHDAIGITFIYVTHDQQEAISISDRVAERLKKVTEEDVEG